MIHEPETRRADIAVTIHKAVRKVLFDHALLLGRTDFRTAEAARDAHAVLLRTFVMLREHAQHEDTVILPEVERSDPMLAHEASAQHDALERQMDEIERLSALSMVATAVERPAIGARLRALFNDFVAAQLAHLSFEEATLMPALWRTHTDAELFALQARIRASTPPDRGLEWRALLLASADAAELAAIGA